MATRLARTLTALGLALALALAATLLPAVAAADGDPASDVLLGEDVFYPYMPAVTTSVQTVLNAETAAARRAGFPIKVALIASESSPSCSATLSSTPPSSTGRSASRARIRCWS